MADLANARIPELPLNSAIKAEYFGVVYNGDNDLTERFPMSSIITSTTSGNFEYLSDTEYLEDDAVTFKGEWWQAIADVPENIAPGTDPAYWTQISKSASGFVFWQAGVYPQDQVFVLKDVSVAHDNSDIRMYWLADSTRPFVSSNFDTELAANKWKQLFVSAVVASAVAEYMQFTFTSDLFTEQALPFRGILTLLGQSITAELTSVSYEVRLDSVSTWTPKATIANVNTWVAANVTGDDLTGLIFWIKCIAVYTTGHYNEASAILKFKR